MTYGNEKKDDQVASSAGQTGAKNSKKGSAGILASVFTKAVHPAPAIHHPRFASIPKNRLPRCYTDAKRLLRLAQSTGAKKHTALLNVVLRGETLDKKRGFEKLLAAIFEQGWAIGILNKTPEGAIDSTGLETHHISCHFVNCTKRPSYFRRNWPKITVVCDTQTHLIASCIVTRGPSYDFGLFEEAVGEAYKQVRFKRMLADGGYDSEANHRIAREIFGMETIIKLNLRGFDKQPKGKHRRETKEKFDKKIYNNRWQIESVFSRNKRLLGSALRNRTEVSRERECLLRVLTHNLMIIRRAA